MQAGGHRPVESKHRLGVTPELPEHPVHVGLLGPGLGEVGTGGRRDRHQGLDEPARRFGQVPAEAQHVGEPVEVGEDGHEDRLAGPPPFLDMENKSPTSAVASPKMRPVIQAAIALPAMSAATNPSARRIVDHSTMTSGSKSRPTDTRKVGMKKALPKKSVTAISGLALGTRRFRPTPTKKAPISGSTPTSSATTADEVRLMNTSM